MTALAGGNAGTRLDSLRQDAEEGVGMTFHFSSVVIPLVVFAPNVLMLAFPLRGILFQSGDPRKVLAFLTALERVGQAGVLVIPLFYRAALILGSGHLPISYASFKATGGV